MARAGGGGGERTGVAYSKQLACKFAKTKNMYNSAGVPGHNEQHRLVANAPTTDIGHTVSISRHSQRRPALPTKCSDDEQMCMKSHN